MIKNACWINVQETEHTIDNDAGYFEVVIPLSMILGFAEDYRKFVVNAKHELILIRSQNDTSAVVQTSIRERDARRFETLKIVLLRIEWLMPYVVESDSYKIGLLDPVGKVCAISMSFRTWELYEYSLRTNTTHVWTVKTSNQL